MEIGVFQLEGEKSIFEKFVNKRNILIKNRNILQSSYVPEQLPHRTAQIDKIVEILVPCLSKEKPSNILIYGKTGTGKTAVLNYIGKELKKADPDESNCSYIYVNCEVVDTPSGILYNIANQIILEPNRKIPFTGWALDKIYYELSTYIDEKNKVFIIVLDEIDRSFKKNGDDIFYFLTTMNEILKKSRVSIIGITNNSKFTEMLSTKIKSRLGEEKIVFNPYNAMELTDILTARAKMAFEDGILAPGVINFCAALSAQESGDARKALDYLRIAAEIAERNGDTTVVEAHVNFARSKIEFDAVIEIINTLTNQSKMVLYSIVQNSKINNRMNTGSVYSTYSDVCLKLGQASLTQRRIAGLISELDMLGLIHAQVKSLGRNGRTKELTLSISKDIIDKFLKDPLFKDIDKFKHPSQQILSED